MSIAVAASIVKYLQACMTRAINDQLYTVRAALYLVHFEASFESLASQLMQSGSPDMYGRKEVLCISSKGLENYREGASPGSAIFISSIMGSSDACMVNQH